MSRNQSNSTTRFNQAVRRFFLSAFVVFAFTAYAIHERLTGSNPASAAANSATGQDASASSSNAAPPSSSDSSSGTSSGSISNSPTQVPVPTNPASSSSSGYKDGTYTGQTIDVNYGLVQVQAQIQKGKLAAVQFLQYPNDRRTSQQINSIAMPYLQQEAIQSQSANVDIISGATLTSEGFQISLQSALASAH
jgi:uncharacterized protein with FMN-binding domain